MSADEPKPIEGEIVNTPSPVGLTKHDEKTVNLLEAAFHNLLNITEACQYAGISRETYYEWLRDDELFEARMSLARGAPIKKAKTNVVAALENGDTATAKWLLERRDPEYKPKAEVENKQNFDDERKRLKEFLDDDDSTDVGGEQPTAADSETVRGEVAEAPTDIS